MNDSSRGLFYRNVAIFRFQPYVDILSIQKFRISLSRLRLSSHRLYIETGRWHQPTSIPIDDRKCDFCNCLEDEYHFIIQCSIYNDLRKSFIPSRYWKHPSMIKFIELINSDNVKIIKQLAIYIEKAFA